MNPQTVLDKIESAHYVVTDAQVEALAHDMYTTNTRAQRIDGVYLRVLLAECQSKLGPASPKRRKSTGDIDAQMVVLDAAHDRFYAAVLRGVTTPDVAADASLEPDERQRRSLERNRRSIFARTAKSTLATYVRAGGDLRSVNVDKATKALLRSFSKPAATTPDAAINRAHAAYIKALTQRCEDNPDEARTEIERAMSELRAILRDLDKTDATQAPVMTPGRAARTVAGAPSFAR